MSKFNGLTHLIFEMPEIVNFNFIDMNFFWDAYIETAYSKWAMEKNMGRYKSRDKDKLNSAR